MAKETITTPEGEKKGYENSNIPRITSDKLFDIFDLNLKRGNAVFVNGLKYRFDGKNKLIIDKNAAKSADIQGKSYEPIIILKKEPSKRKFNPSKHLNPKAEKNVTHEEEINRTLLEGKSYAPQTEVGRAAFIEMGKEEIEKRIGLATILEGFGVSIDFLSFTRDLGEINRTDELKRELDNLKGTKDAPKYLFEVLKLQETLQSK